VSVTLGCASVPPNPSDPWESFNRPVFNFNDDIDGNLLAPVAKGWAFITPKAFRVSLDRFFHNWMFVVRFLSNLGQAEALHAGVELGRFVTNTSIGFLGFFDPATHFGIARYDEDFGQMFGRWGVPSGPYWVLPFVGPSNPRDAFGFLFDAALSLPPYATVPRLINSRAIASGQINMARQAALDFYVFVRDAHIQARYAAVHDLGLDATGIAEATSDDFYELSDEDYELPDEDYDIPEDAYEPVEDTDPWRDDYHAKETPSDVVDTEEPR
jgi:phospholipid-binding lipoprotein MlaA